MKTIVTVLIALVLTSVYLIINNKHTQQMTAKQKVLKMLYPLIMRSGKSKKNSFNNENKILPVVDFYSLSVTLNNDSIFNMASIKGKKVLLVNTASDCGFTAQYESLEKLYRQYKDKLLIIGFPSNDFSNQEKRNDNEIAAFCKMNYGVTFMLSKKVVVSKNSQQNEVYKWLTNKNSNGWNDNPPSWNFCKYIVDENGMLTHFFKSAIDPTGTEMKKALGFSEKD